MNCLSCVNLSKMLANFTINLWIKFPKLSLILKFIKHELSTASLQSLTGIVIYHFTCRRLQTGSRKLVLNRFYDQRTFQNPGRASSIFKFYGYWTTNLYEPDHYIYRIKLPKVSNMFHTNTIEGSYPRNSWH